MLRRYARMIGDGPSVERAARARKPDPSIPEIPRRTVQLRSSRGNSRRFHRSESSVVGGVSPRVSSANTESAL